MFLKLPKRAQDAIRKSNLGQFGDEVFPLIDVNELMVLYSDNGCGLSYIQGLVGAYFVMRMLDITADEMLLRIDTDIAIQYTFHIISMGKQPFSRRNLFYFIARLEAYEKETGINFIEEGLKKITSSFAHDMGLDKFSSCGRIKNAWTV